MGKINVLTKDIYNLIAAGEVVERPASVVKELVENAIDAGAKNISITVADGGLSLIEVADDGCGIEADDVKNAFLQHATSKLAIAGDLNSIKTLGFRGEALSSIAAVSKTTLKTCVNSTEIGTEIVLNGGEIDSFTQVGCQKGTVIRVQNLFFNVPARKKFLKTNAGEGTEIAALAQRLALANPKIAFTLLSNDKTVLLSLGKGLEAAVFAVYGKDCLENCLKVKWFYKDIRVWGYIGKPDFVKANRNCQTLIVNGRYVKNVAVSSAVQRAYQKYMTTRHFPFFVLNVDIPLDKIDVNVHPNKLDVRFSDAQDIFLAVYTAITTTLRPDEIDRIPEILLRNETTSKSVTPADSLEQLDIARLVNDSAKQVLDAEKCDEDEPFDITRISTPNFLEDTSDAAVDAAKRLSQVPVNEALLHAKVSGKLFETYIILETVDAAYIVDQHAAHEMLLYKRFNQDFSSGNVTLQDMLVPFVFTVGDAERDFLTEYANLFTKQGFDLQPFGTSTFKINHIPALLSHINMQAFVDSVLNEYSNIAPQSKFLSEYLAKQACKAAVKAGESLNESELAQLKKELAFSDTLRCPHGRPVVVKMLKSEIEKWFRRIQ
jgi:DNA mismatch repair protein MutL